MTSCEAGNNPILQYWQEIESGRVLVCKKVKRVYRKLVDDILNPKDNWIYDNDRAQRVIDFVQRFCRQSKGKFGGKLLILQLWQKAYLAATFGFVDKDTGFRKYTESMLIVARKMEIGTGQRHWQLYAVCRRRKGAGGCVGSNEKRPSENSMAGSQKDD